jgi:pimeloyl-ACP methyl ester carboxylesterase
LTPAQEDFVPLPLLLVHGQPGSSADFAPLRQLLNPTRTVLVPDRPGWGESGEVAGGFAHNASAMVRALDEADVDCALVIGYSWGGGVALALAENHPERVAGLVLVSSVGPHSVGWIDRLPILPTIGTALTTSGFVTARAGLLLVGLAQQIRRGKESANHSWVHALSRSFEGRHGIASFMVEQRALFDELDAIVAQAGEVRAVTIVLTGDRDRVVPLATASALADAIPDARLHIVPGGSHPLPVFAPEAVVRAIEDLEVLLAQG